jgi:hypothetical protein
MVTGVLSHLSALRPPASGLEPLPPPITPARPGGASGPLFRERAGGEGAFVTVQVPEAPSHPPAQAPPLQPGRHRATRPGRTDPSERGGTVPPGACICYARPTSPSSSPRGRLARSKVSCCTHRVEAMRDVYATRSGGIPVRTIIAHKNERSEVFEEWRRISDRL